MTPPVFAPFRRRRRLLAGALTAALAALAPAVPAAGAIAPAAAARSVPAFYDPPADLPADNGALVRTEPLTLGLRLPGLNGPLPGTATRLMYRSTDANGEPVAVTGAYLEPAADWAHDGPRPLVAVAPGTMGQGDRCAASLALENPLALHLDDAGLSLSVGYENLAVYRLLARGVAVVVTDYAGLGTTDRVHTYVNRVDEAHALLDAVRAARALPEASVTDASPVGLYGYSQGGGATAAAAELHPAYAPELPLVGAYSGAAPADLTEVIGGIDGSALAAALGWSVNGIRQAEPALEPVIAAHLNDAGRSALAATADLCIGDGLLRYGFSRSTAWTAGGESLADIVAAEPAVRDFLADQYIGRLRPEIPVRVATGVQDDIVRHQQTRQLAADWCALGATVAYQPVRLPNLGDRLLTNHVAPLLADQGAALSWLTDRLTGEPATSNCEDLPDLP